MNVLKRFSVLTHKNSLPSSPAEPAENVLQLPQPSQCRNPAKQHSSESGPFSSSSSSSYAITSASALTKATTMLAAAAAPLHQNCHHKLSTEGMEALLKREEDASGRDGRSYNAASWIGIPHQRLNEYMVQLAVWQYQSQHHEHCPQELEQYQRQNLAVAPPPPTCGTASSSPVAARSIPSSPPRFLGSADAREHHQQHQQQRVVVAAPSFELITGMKEKERVRMGRGAAEVELWVADAAGPEERVERVGDKYGDRDMDEEECVDSLWEASTLGEGDAGYEALLLLAMKEAGSGRVEDGGEEDDEGSDTGSVYSRSVDGAPARSTSSSSPKQLAASHPPPSTPHITPQTATLHARSYQAAMLGAPVDTTPLIPYNAASAFGWRLVHSTQVLCPQRYAVLSRAIRAGLAQISFLGGKDVVLERLVAGGHRGWEEVEGAWLSSSLQTALRWGEWRCALNAEGEEHDSKVCECTVKVRRVLVCSVLPEAVRRRGAEMVVRKGRCEGVLAWRMETFAWGEEQEEDGGAEIGTGVDSAVVRRFADGVRAEVERERPGGRWP